MSVAEFCAWAEAQPERWELVDGFPVAMAPANRTHGAIQAELCHLITAGLIESGSACSVIGAPGVIPHVRANANVRIPDIAVCCSNYDAEQAALTDPTVLIEILSPSNASRTWGNVWTYTTIPSVLEIAVFETAAISALLLRRLPEGGWPKEPELVESGDVSFQSLSVRFPLAAAYRTTRLA